MKIYTQKASGYTEEVDEGFNGWAFLFGALWYLYKRMIWQAIGVFVGIIILVVLFGWIGAIIGWFIIGFTANRTYESFLITKGYTSQNIRSHKKKFRKKK